MPSNVSVALDSCVVIDYLQGSAGKHPERLLDIEPLIEGAKTDKYIIVVSALCIAEVVRANGVGKDMSSEDDNKIKKFFQQPYIEPRPLTRDLAHDARAIVRAASSKVTAHDAIHIATAIACKCLVLYTYDNTHLTPQDGQHGCPPLSEPLKIKMPDATRGTLWETGDDES